MKSVDRLVAEHDIIERGPDVLETLVIRVESGQAVPAGLTAWIPEFFSQFADKYHHAKEEDLFFPALKERGILEEGGPIGAMLSEHTLGRDCVRRMREANATVEFDDTGFVEAAQEFIPLLRQYILKKTISSSKWQRRC